MLGQHHLLIGGAGVIAAEAIAFSHGLSLTDFPGATLLGHDVSYLPAVAVGAVASLLPDLDQPKSMVANFSPLTRMASLAAYRAFHHRGPIHSLPAWGIFSFLAIQYGAQSGLYYCALAASLGFLLHMVGDSFTHHGVPWFWPLYRHSLGFPLLRFTTGSTLEYAAVVAVIVATTVLVQSSGLALFG